MLFTDITITLAASIGFRILGAATNDHNGWSVSAAGDIDGDGVDDVVVGAFLAESPNMGASNDAGTAYVIFGKNMTGCTGAFGDVDLTLVNPGSILGFRIIGAEFNDYCGYSVSGAGGLTTMTSTTQWWLFLRSICRQG